MARIIVTPAPTIESARVYQVSGRGVGKSTRIRPNGVLDQDSQVGLNHFAGKMASLDDLKEMYARLKAKGVPIRVGDHTVSIGIYFSDPDGNGMEVYYESPRSEWRRDTPFSGDGDKGRFPGPWDEELRAQLVRP